VVATVPISWIGVRKPSANSIELEDEVRVKEDVISQFPVM